MPRSSSGCRPDRAWRKPTGAGFGLTSPFAPRPVPVDAAATQKVVWLETVFGWLAGLILAAMASGLVRKGGKDG